MTILHSVWHALTRLFKKEPPADPYSYVTAPKRPRPPNRSAAAVAELDDN